MERKHRRRCATCCRPARWAEKHTRPIGFRCRRPRHPLLPPSTCPPRRAQNPQVAWGAALRSMAVADTQEPRLLEGLRLAGGQAVAFAELHAGGIDFPAAVVSELELNGYAIERVYDHGRMIGVRLFGPEPPAAPPRR